MWKNSVLALTLLVAGLLVWSCGDGSVDSLTDNELIMITRFPSTIDYDMLDSIVDACKKDKECWEKAKKSGEIYKGDFAKILRDSSGNIIIQEGDSAYIWKDGKKLPVFDIPSNNEEGDDDVTTSGSMETSGSSSKRSSASGYEKDEGSGNGDDPNSAGGGAGGKSRNHAEESSSSGNASGNGSSVDASQYTNPSSSSKGTYSGSSTSHERSSSSKNSSSSADLSSLTSTSVPTTSAEEEVEDESSSSSKQQLSAGSESSHGGGGGNTNLKCGDTPISGTCKPNKVFVKKGENVTYTYTPSSGSCQETSTILWLAGDADASTETQSGGWTFTVSFAKLGSKTGTYFMMDNTRIPCDDVMVEPTCNTANTYSCTGRLVSTYNNLTKSNPVTYTWTLSKNGCYDIDSVLWKGAVSEKDVLSVTKDFRSIPSTSSVSVIATNEIGKKDTVTCSPAAVVRNVTETAPSCNVVDIPLAGTGASITVTPTSVSGCDYDSDKCSYVLEGGSASVNGSGYGGGALRSITGETTEGSVEYTLTLSNKVGDGSCYFTVGYVTPIEVILTYGGSLVDITEGLNHIYSTNQNSGQLRCQASEQTTVMVDGKSVTIGTSLNSVPNAAPRPSVYVAVVVPAGKTIQCKAEW